MSKNTFIVDSDIIIAKPMGAVGCRGFTLIELMVVVAIVAVLAAVALPNYRQYVVRSNRAAAQAQMMDMANREEQFLLANRVYASKDALQAGGYSMPGEVSSNYDFDIALGTDAVPSYVITFTPKGGQSGDGALSLNNRGEKSPAGKW